MKNIGNINLKKNSFETSKKQKIIDRITEKGYFTKYPISVTLSILFCFISNGIIVNIFNLIIMPTIEYFKASDFMMEIMAGISFIGAAFGAICAIILSEKYSRTKIIKFFTGLMCITHLISTIYLNLTIFFISRIILGFTVGINEPLIFNTFGEYLPTRYRGLFLMISWLFYLLGVFIYDILALIIMPNLESEYLQKYLLSLNIVFILNFLVNYFFLYDSPRNLIIKSMQVENFYEREKKINEALKILNNMNKSPLTQAEEQQLINELYHLSTNKNENKSSFKELFSIKYFKTTIIGLFSFFVYACGYYGFYIISTLTLEILNKKENEGKMENNNNINVNITYKSNKDIIINQIYLSFFDLFGSFLAGFLAEIKCIGRKGVLGIFMLISAISLIPSCYSVTLFNIFFTISLSSGSIYGDMIITYLSEIFPTKLRDISSSFFLTSHRVSGFISQFLFLALFKINYKIPFFLGSLIHIIGVILIFKLPFESIGKPLDYEEIFELTNKNQIEF